MSERRESPTTNRRREACPECGEDFTSRGLAAHRRQRHGAPARTEMRAVLESLASIRGVLESLSGVLLRFDERLIRIEDTQAAAADPASDTRSLERGIAETLEEIGRVKAATDLQLTEWGGHARTEEERALEQTAFTRMAALRTKQASLVYRLRELQAAQAADAACL